MGVSLRHFSPSSFWASRNPRVSSSFFTFLLPRHTTLPRTVAITRRNGGYYCTTTVSGGFQNSGSSTVEFSEEWKLCLGSNTARMVPPTGKQVGALSVWRKEEINRFRERNEERAKSHDDDYFKGFVQ